MSNSNLDSVESTLRSLKDIVERNHSETVEPSLLVQDMERLISEIKAKTTTDINFNAFNKIIEAPTVVLGQTPTTVRV